jgi:hypothetical protein
MSPHVEVTLPLRLVNGANAREHWAVRKRRASEHRDAVVSAMTVRLTRAGLIVRVAKERALTGPVLITLTRLSPGTRPLDFDGLVISCKHVRDGVADALGVDDADPRLDFLYRQERAKSFGVRIEIRAQLQRPAEDARP